MAKKAQKTGVWILCDQLNPKISALKKLSPGNVHVCLIEQQAVPTKRKCHQKKLVLHFASMRHFHKELEQLGYSVAYYAIDEKDAKISQAAEKGLGGLLEHFIKTSGVKKLRRTEPNDYEQHLEYHEIDKSLPVPVEVLPNNLFLNSLDEFKEWENSQDDLVMENYYRIIRRKLKVLMEGDYPTGGRWNYDIENRVPPMENMKFTPLPQLPEDPIVKKVEKLVSKEFSHFPGKAEGFSYPVTRKEAEDWFEDFAQNRLRLFGMYQDAMVKENWFMYHSVISPMMNIGLLEPENIVRRVEDSYHNSNTPINSAEGFIRQVIGWREYVRGIYWSRMPEYGKVNFFEYQDPVPQMFKDGKTRMNCVRLIVNQTEKYGYAHHIQRLMIAGNFFLIAGIKPQEAAEWFMENYIDAYEWVVYPNVLGMILFADGGYLGTKPYAASANYIGKMSDYCKGCFYKPRKRVGERACPFNFLYWNFLQKNAEALKSNKRMTMVYNLLKRKSEGEINLVDRSSSQFLEKIRKNGTDRPGKK
jgi:deoxyribodipyrimidine photolyase-related protein